MHVSNLFFYKQMLKQNKNRNTDDDNKLLWITILYIPNISDKFKSITRNLEIKLTFYNFNKKLGRLIKVHKIYSQIIQRKDVYKILCNDCDAFYVDQTERQLKKLISEHKDYINKNIPSNSIITEHRLTHNHNFDWKNIQILDSERFLNKRFQKCYTLNFKKIILIYNLIITECLHK